MVTHSEDQKSDLVSRTLSTFESRLKDTAQAKVAQEFAKAFLEDAPPEDILDETPENLAGAIASLWHFAGQRQARTAKLRVYNPDEKQDGWTSQHSALEIVNDDMPFLVDSVTAALNQMEIEVYLVVHPILLVERDDAGNLSSVADPADPQNVGRPESNMLLLISEQPKSRHKKVEKTLAAVLEDVRASVEDWRLMRQRCWDIIKELDRDPPRLPRDEISEGIAFLEWLDDDHFTYLGFREYRFTGKGKSAVAEIDSESGLGLLRDPQFSVFDGLRDLGKLPADVQDWLKKPELLRITKANSRSTVHRPTHLDTIAIKTFNSKGEVTGERLFIGLFTSTAYSRSPRHIPLLRHKVDETIEQAGFVPGSHNGKALLHILETFPRDELFQIHQEELTEIALGILNLQERQRTALFVRKDPFERFVSCLIYVPRDRFDTNLRHKLQHIVAEAYAGEVSSFQTMLGDSPLARLHVIVATKRGKVPKVDVRELESRIAYTARSWVDSLERCLVEHYGEQRGHSLLRRYGRAFSNAYKEQFTEEQALKDVQLMEKLDDGHAIEMDLYRPADSDAEQLNFKVFVPERPVHLSDVMPMLENMGLRVIGEVPYVLKLDDEQKKIKEAPDEIWIHDFELERQSSSELDVEKFREAFHEVFQLVWSGRLENDGFNRLVLAAGLAAREIRIMRAFCRFLRQTQIPFSQAYMEDTLARNSELTRQIAGLFLRRFDPKRAHNRKQTEKDCAKLVTEIEAGLDDVTNLDEDRILRRYLNLVLSTLRTNYFQPDETGTLKPYISFKFDADMLEELPQPRPFREIFVYSPRVEGVHLRFGAVARGGLRWSDRREDFRTEILGLVKAQQVKNAVIVPVGAKGGFVPKRLPPPEAGRDAVMNEGIESYKTFIRALLDVTDNLVEGKVVPPENVVRYDDDDPYMVVAADKGTATFSDIANGVAADYGFWLDDAFASGGSEGYDHKEMGITARGAWESVMRHFREVGHNTQEEDFTVIGVGDMSGDVFGNGMLLSKHIRLIGAFNHLHIFVDPDPDAEASWKERKRLFEKPRSSWTDYDSKLISKGGGVFDRKAKSIPVSAEMKACFGLEKDKVTPNELVTAILKSQADLLWFGGIGTYIKASSESNAEVGDRNNDPIRVDGRDLNVRVIGEGANLGMTQKARIEFALAGGRINTDAIDNSAGVDCSDHEVNIKILLRGAVEAGKLSRKRRNALLEEMTEEVAALVLKDNYLQTQTISISNRLGVRLLDRFARFIRALEKADLLNRSLEALPDDETLKDRATANIGLTRPELAVLLAYAKITLYEPLVESNLPDDDWLDRDLLAYFPQPLQQKYAKYAREHRLRREILATQLTNEVINRLGITFVFEMMERTGESPEQVLRAYVAARDSLALPELWQEIETLDNKVNTDLQAKLLTECGRLAERISLRFLRQGEKPLDIRATVERHGKGSKELFEALPSLLEEPDKGLLEQEAREYMANGVPESLAWRVAGLKHMTPASDIIQLAQTSGRSVTKTASLYFDVGARFGCDWLRRTAGRLPRDAAWTRSAITALVDDIYDYQADITAEVLTLSEKGGDPEEALKAWTEQRFLQVNRLDQLLGEVLNTQTPDLAMLTVANRQLKALING
ncbi:NAD-glutamate dehydrogenase [Fodinicurvata fenggangensis]|uniref:NAD-glutamate dehydrogenase n=1 Tax=Fodinicurvata fenggangensis TaxID=1121830 RepID=UPI00047996B5|nr:NAD-glutamate dehydrogenase [Fodinicurvata fenggangensis]